MAVFLSNYVFPNSRRPNSVTDFDLALYYPLEILVDVACPWPDHMVLFWKSLKNISGITCRRIKSQMKNKFVSVIDLKQPV